MKTETQQLAKSPGINAFLIIKQRKITNGAYSEKTTLKKNDIVNHMRLTYPTKVGFSK